MHPHITGFNLDLGAQTAQPLEVEIDRARANHATARQRDYRLLQAR